MFNNYLTIRYNEYSTNLEEPIEGEKIIEGKVSVPLIGSKTELSGEVKTIYTNIMKDNNITLKDFQTPFSKKLGSKGTFRAIGMEPINLKLCDISDDEINEEKTKATISFQLRRGSYATEILKQIIK